MATTVNIKEEVADAVNGKAKAKSRKALKAKNQVLDNNNGSAQNPSTKIIARAPAVVSESNKENVLENFNQLQSAGGGKGKGRSKSKTKTKAGGQNQKEVENPKSVEEELETMRAALENLQIEKEEAQKLVRQQDALLKEKDQQIHLKDLAHEKLQTDLTKLKRTKGFNPNLPNLSLSQSVAVVDKKEKKKKKDYNKTKRPCPAYVLWCKDQWKQVKSENPDAVFKDVATVLGPKWKTLSEEEKKPYEEQYEAEKKQYLQVISQEKRETEAMKLLHEEQKQKTALDLLEQYMQYSKEVEGDRKAKKAEKDPLKPKQPVSAFFAFCNEKRPALQTENRKILEISKILGERWKGMTTEEKAPYEQIAAEAKLKYMQEMGQYRHMKAKEQESLSREIEERNKLEKEQALQLLRRKERVDALKAKASKKKQSKKENADPNKPKKPPTSFLLFSKETRKTLVSERPGIDNATLSALISVKWKELGEEGKKKWIDEANTAMEQYKQDMESYRQTNGPNGHGGPSSD